MIIFILYIYRTVIGDAFRDAQFVSLIFWQCLFHVDICIQPYTHNHHDFNAIGVQLCAINSMH